MTEPLSKDRLDLLLPVLEHLAQLIRKNRDMDREDLGLLLLANSLDEEWAISELERWKKVLITVRSVSDSYKHEIAQRSLMLRGIPEANAMLAIHMVTSGQESSSKVSKRLESTVESLNFGALPPGKSAIAEFDVQGGPGQILIENDRVQVNQMDFGEDKTRIKVEIKPVIGAVWTSLKLISQDQILEIPVTVIWEAPESPKENINELRDRMSTQSQSMSEEVTVVAAARRAELEQQLAALRIPSTSVPHRATKGYKLSPSGKHVQTIKELVGAFIENRETGINHLYGNDLEIWIKETLKRPDLAIKAQLIRKRRGDRIAGLRDFLLATGVLSTDQRKLIDDWIKPVLHVYPTSLLFTKHKLNHKIIITNEGGGILSGNLKANHEWINVEPSTFSCSQGQSGEIVVSLNTVEMYLLSILFKNLSSFLTINSNGGRTDLTVEYERS